MNNPALDVDALLAGRPCAEAQQLRATLRELRRAGLNPKIAPVIEGGAIVALEITFDAPQRGHA